MGERGREINGRERERGIGSERVCACVTDVRIGLKLRSDDLFKKVCFVSNLSLSFFHRSKTRAQGYKALLCHNLQFDIIYSLS